MKANDVKSTIPIDIFQETLSAMRRRLSDSRNPVLTKTLSGPFYRSTNNNKKNNGSVETLLNMPVPASALNSRKNS